MKSKRRKNPKKYTPVLSRMSAPRESWEDKAPRLTESQKEQIQRITRGVYNRHMKDRITRNTFNEVHERIEEEVAEAVKNNMGLIAAIDWRVIFGESAIHFFKQAGMDQPSHIDGVLPTDDFITSPLFDYIEIFEPVVTMFQFEDYDKFISSAEQSITEAERRRAQGDAYYTERDKQINFKPAVGPGE